MQRIILLVFATLSVAVSSFAADDTYWKFFNFQNQTPDQVILLFGPPALIETQERYSDWVKHKASGCGQISTYAMGYHISAGGNILKGPLGMASEVRVIIDSGKVCEVVWTYDKNQLKPAFREWMNHKKLSRIGGKKPSVVMISIWKPKKGTIITVDCYTGGAAAMCQGPISVHYGEDTQKGTAINE